jgi:hypothetical protein
LRDTGTHLLNEPVAARLLLDCVVTCLAKTAGPAVQYAVATTRASTP